MKILAIESSCDETGAAVVELTNGGVRLHSNVVATSLSMHAKTGGIIPEQAAREQIKYIIPTVAEALEKANIPFNSLHNPAIDALAVTYGPGLIGSLLVGVETVKTLSYLWNKPLIPVNHLFGHIYANWIGNEEDIPTFPLIALIVSGGHTDLLLMKSHSDITWLGGTRDDAAGEAFDKIGRLLNLPYPAGPKIEQLAKTGNPKVYHLPRPLLHEGRYDFSFSGLKTAALREVQKMSNITGDVIKDLSRSVQDAITETLVKKTIKAAEEFGVESILLSGGVGANQTLRDSFIAEVSQRNVRFYAPPKNLCTDNAAMIGAAACFRNQEIPWQDVSANPELYFD